MKFNWNLRDPRPTKPYTYATTFSGAGGCSLGMSYLNGYTNVFCNDVAAKQMNLYLANLKPRYSYLMPIQDLLTSTLPTACSNLDILQQSFPCTLFSAQNLVADKMKGKEVTLSECGGNCQIVDELYIDAINLVEKLQPKVSVFENVMGLLFKKNKEYVDDIYKRMEDIGYTVKHFVVNGEDIGLPQKRRRVFFIATRKDIPNTLTLDFNESTVYIKDVPIGTGLPRPLTPGILNMLKHYEEGDKDVGVINYRVNGKRAGFAYNLQFRDSGTFNTVTTKSHTTIIVDKEVDGTFTFTGMTDEQLSYACSFPQDYDWLGYKSLYGLGMSVPPLMMAKIAEQIEEQILVPFYQKEVK